MPNRGLYVRLRAIVAWLCARLYRVEIRGAEHIPRTGGCVLAANHESSIDPALLALTTERPIRFLARAELWLPGLRRLLDALGGIPVRRGEGDSVAIARATAALEAGEVVAIFPQGTSLGFRNRRYRRGAARLALAAGVPVVPVRLLGTASAFSVLPPRLGLPKLRVLVGSPLQTTRSEADRAAVNELTAALEHRIETLDRAPGDR